MNDWRLDSIGQHDDSPPVPPTAAERGGATADAGGASGRQGLRRGAGTLVVLLAVAGFGGALWYAYDTYRTQGGAGIAPLIRADLTPTRIKPEQPGGMDVPHRDRLVLEDPAGEPEAGTEIALVDSAEAPLPAPDAPAADAPAAETATAETSPAPAGSDPIGDLIAGATPKVDGPERAVEPSKAEADAATGDGADAVPALPAEPVEVAQLTDTGIATDATPAPVVPTGAAAGTTGTPAASLDTPATVPPPEGTEALIARTIEVAQAEPDAATAPIAEPDADADEEGLPEISTTPLLTPEAGEDAAEPADPAPTGAMADEATETPAATGAGTDTATTETAPAPAAPAPQVVFALPLGALDEAAAADLRVAEAIAPAGFNASAALTALGTSPSTVDETAAAPVTTADAPTDTAAAAETETADAAPADPPAAAPVQSAAVPDGAARVQLAALPSDAEARAEFTRFQERFPDLLSGLDLFVPTVEVEGRTWYRLQVGPLDPSGAQQLCNALKEQGQDCIVRN